MKNLSLTQLNTFEIDKLKFISNLKNNALLYAAVHLDKKKLLNQYCKVLNQQNT